MPLRIRKELQDDLKASLDGAPSVASAPAEPAPAVEQQPAIRKPRRKAAKRPAKATRARKAKPKVKRRRKPSTAVGFRDLRPEIATILAMFDMLTLSAADPERVKALKSLTKRYLAEDPSPEKLEQVRALLLRQAGIIRREREAAAATAAIPMIEAVAAAPDPGPLPGPDRLRRGEIDRSATPAEAKPPAAAAVAPALPPQAKRRTILSWLRRSGGSGGSKGGSGGDSADAPGVPFRRKLRIALMASVWLGIGGVTISYAAALIYVNWARIEIDSAMVSGNIEPVNAPFDGSITSMLVKAGDRLFEGARYMVMEDPEVEKLVRMASVKVERAREDLKLKQAELESEKQKRDEYIAISRNKMEKILSDIDAFEKQEKVARERFYRLSDLFKKGIVIRPRVEEASDKLAELTTQLHKARINQKEREEQFKNVMAGHFYDGNQVVGRLKESEAAHARAAAEVDLAFEELQVMQQRRQINRVNAAHDARVLRVLRQEGAAVKRGDTMLVVERMDERVIHAFLRQEEITRIAIGDDANVFVPALQARLTARVVQIDRNAAFLDDVDARYSWKIARDGGVKATDKDRTARVTLRFETADRAVADQKLDIGMPTVVSFRRRSVNSVFPSFTNIGS